MEMNAMVSCDENRLSVVDSKTEVVEYWDYPIYWPIHYDYCDYIHCYPSTKPEKSKVEQAFNIVQKLMEKKIIPGLRVKQFIELVNDIAGII